jgi:hypothetical protein
MTTPNQLDDETRRKVVDIFRRYGVEGEVSLAPPKSGDEIAFVVSASAAAKLPIASVTRELIDLLQRKVWIATEGADWGGELRPLQ